MRWKKEEYMLGKRSNGSIFFLDGYILKMRTCEDPYGVRRRSDGIRLLVDADDELVCQQIQKVSHKEHQVGDHLGDMKCHQHQNINSKSYHCSNSGSGNLHKGFEKVRSLNTINTQKQHSLLVSLFPNEENSEKHRVQVEKSG